MQPDTIAFDRVRQVCAEQRADELVDACRHALAGTAGWRSYMRALVQQIDDCQVRKPKARNW
jgi:hypothetical protein